MARVLLRFFFGGGGDVCASCERAREGCGNILLGRKG
jgi:hypothetical protein